MLPVVKIIPLKIMFKEEIPSLYKKEIAEVNTVIPIVTENNDVFNLSSNDFFTSNVLLKKFSSSSHFRCC